MEGAGKMVDDEELREAMKENGIGRPSTRAAIIETLFKRGYMVRSGKTLRATDAGIALIATINEELLKSAKLTGLWESKLRKIERGLYSAHEFVDELKTLIAEIVINVLSDNTSNRIIIEDSSSKGAKKEDKKAEKKKSPSKPSIRKLEQIVCPKCGAGHIVKGRKAYGCSRFREGCDMLLTFEEYPSDLTPGKLNAMIKKQYGKS